MAEEDGFWQNLREGDLGGLGRNVWEGARDEWLGIDDFGRFVSNLREGNFLSALKSLGAGALELGGTALMFVPGGQLATLATKGGKAGKALNLIRPLSLAERQAAKAVGASGAKRSLFKAGEAVAGGAAERKGMRRLLGGLDEAGYGRGGVAGSAVRGVGQITGLLPTAQGPLARGLVGGRVRAPFLSGKLTPLAQRTGVDEALMSGDMSFGGPAPAPFMPVQYTPLDILYLMSLQNSPRSA